MTAEQDGAGAKQVWQLSGVQRLRAFLSREECSEGGLLDRPISGLSALTREVEYHSQSPQVKNCGRIPVDAFLAARAALHVRYLLAG